MGKGWKCRKCLEQGITSWQVRDTTRVFSVVTELSGYVLRQDLVLAGCSWVASVFALCCDNVMIEVPLSRSRRSLQEVRVATEVG